MHPEIRVTEPGACPKCGMALEPVEPVISKQSKTEWVCPMHPEIVRDAPGSCPICGMALEPKTITAEEEENSELIAMTRRFWVSAALTVPLFIIAMPGRGSLPRLRPPAQPHHRSRCHELQFGVRYRKRAPIEANAALKRERIRRITQEYANSGVKAAES